MRKLDVRQLRSLVEREVRTARGVIREGFGSQGAMGLRKAAGDIIRLNDTLDLFGTLEVLSTMDDGDIDVTLGGEAEINDMIGQLETLKAVLVELEGVWTQIGLA